MSLDELENWFFDKFNSCYPIILKNEEDCIYMIYNENYIRAKKLANILNKDVEYPSEVNGVCLFQQDYQLRYLWCDSELIWDFFEKHYNVEYREIRSLIERYLEKLDIELIPECANCRDEFI